MNAQLPTKRGLGTGSGRERRIETPEQLYEEFEAYIVFAEENLDSAVVRGQKIVPWTITSFCHFLGVRDAVWRKWRNEREDLKAAIDVVEDRIIDKLARCGLLNLLHAGLTAHIIERHERKRAAQAALPAPPPTVAAQHIADMWHPEMTIEQEAAIRAAGVAIPLYPQALIEQGIPFHMPVLPPKDESDG